MLVKITANSLCSSDLAGIAGHLMLPLPYVPGHEPVGRIVQLGPATTSSFKLGDRVGYMPASRVCGSCRSCLTGNHRFCKTRQNWGFSGKFGGFSQYTLADPISTVKIPESLSDEEAAPLLCAGVTAYGAVKKATQYRTPGTWINIVGSGGLGHLVIQYAAKLGYDVQAFDVAEDELELAKACGAKRVFNSSRHSPDDVQKTICTIVVSGVIAAYEWAFKVTEDHGKVIAIGAPNDPVPINILDMIIRDVSLISECEGVTTKKPIE